MGRTVRRKARWGQRVRQQLDCEEKSLEGGEHRDGVYEATVDCESPRQECHRRCLQYAEVTREEA